MYGERKTQTPRGQAELDTLAARYPRTIAAFTAMGALEHLERIIKLDTSWDELRRTTEHREQRTEQQAEFYSQSATCNPSTEFTLSTSTALSVNSAEVLRTGLQSAIQYDLIYAGGGLGLLHAVVMAQRGYRVLLFDRGEVGCAHREWNISREELRALIEVGFCSWSELDEIVVAEYDIGVVRFHAPKPADMTELRMADVLHIALDAGGLLRLARRKLAEAGGVILDHRAFRGVTVGAYGPMSVVVELARDDGALERHTARLLLDGMGSSSPLALRRFAAGTGWRQQRQPFAGVCPTVGTVAAGFVAGAAPNQHNPRIGDILISVADAQRGQQYMWEGFPGRGDDLTVYLFYYDILGENRGPRTKNHRITTSGSQLTLRVPVLGSSAPNLMQLFEDYFTLLPTYKRPGPEFRHIKPVYGYIPARHGLRWQAAPLLRGVLPIGDSAAQQSPLTFCGFGSHVRNLARTTELLHEALRHDLLTPAQLQPISAYQVNVSLNWVFSRFMQPWRAPDDVNKLQNLFLGVLNDLGEDLARRFFRDHMRWADYHRMVLGMFRRHPRIILIAWQVLGPAGVRQWIGDYLGYSCAALAAWAGRRIGARGRAALANSLARFAPAIGLRLRAHFAEWRAMGWI